MLLFAMLIAFLLVLALVLFVVAGLSIEGPRFRPGWYGAAALTLAYLIQNWPG